MNAEYFFADESGEREEIEAVVDFEPNILALHRAELAETTGAEPKVIVHVAVLVVAPDQEHLGGVEELQGEKQGDDFDREGAAVYKVTQKNVVHGQNVALALVGPGILVKKLN